LVLVLNSKYTMPYESRCMHNKAQSSQKIGAQHDAIIKTLLGFHCTTPNTYIKTKYSPSIWKRERKAKGREENN
jgi:hypothetical protein